MNIIKITILLAASLGLTVMPALGFCIPPASQEKKLVYYGKVAPQEIIMIKNPHKANIKKWHAQFGSRVQKGDRLVELESETIESALSKAHLDYQLKKQNWEKIKNWKNGKEVSQAKHQSLLAQTEYSNKKTYYENTLKLYELGIVSKTECETDKCAMTQALNAEKEARLALADCLARGAALESKIAESEFVSAKQKWQQYQAQKSGLMIKAPINGLLIKADKLLPQKNDRFNSDNQIIAGIASTDKLTIKFPVDEFDVLKINKNNKVNVCLRAYGLQIPGRIILVEAQSLVSQDNKAVSLFDVVVEFDAKSHFGNNQHKILALSAQIEMTV